VLRRQAALDHVTETGDSGMCCKVSDNRSEAGAEWLCVKDWHNFVTNDLTALLAVFPIIFRTWVQRYTIDA